MPHRTEDDCAAKGFCAATNVYSRGTSERRINSYGELLSRARATTVSV